MDKNLSKLEQNLNITFNDKDILTQALVHRSFLNENPSFKLGHNERMEFLGDAVLELVVTRHLFLNFPETPEGDMTNLRASLVNSQMLAEIGNELGLEPFLFLSRGESRDKNHKAKQYILANAVEALIGAIYLDQGYEKTQDFITKKIMSKLDYILDNKLYLDPKTHFQETSQELMGVTPTYEVLRQDGPDHNKHFVIGIYLKDELIAEGSGGSKQEAEISAARKGLKIKGWNKK